MTGTDSDLIATCRRFWAEYEAWAELFRAWLDLKYKSDDAGAAEVAREHSNDAHERVGAALQAVFSTPAVTAEGIREKMLVLREAKDLDREQYQELTCWEDEPRQWFGSVLADLEQLAEASEGAKA